MPRENEQAMQDCIEACLDCYQICLQEAMNHCFDKGGEHVRPMHFGLMMNCAEICRTAAEFMMSRSPLHARICAACAEVCEACAQSCEQIAGLQASVQACRRCAESCRRMADGVSFRDFEGSPSQTSESTIKAPM